MVIHQKHPRLPPSTNPHQPKASRLFQLLLRAELVGVAALLLTAVGGTRGETSLSCKVRIQSGGGGNHRLVSASDGDVAVGTYVALAADGLLAVVLGGEGLEGGLDDTTTETEDQVESGLLLGDYQYFVPGFIKILRSRIRLLHLIPDSLPKDSTHLLDVVVGEGAAVLELLAGEDQTLLVWGNALLVLDLALHIVDGVGGLHLKGDSLTGDCAVS